MDDDEIYIYIYICLRDEHHALYIQQINQPALCYVEHTRRPIQFWHVPSSQEIYNMSVFMAMFPRYTYVVR